MNQVIKTFTMTGITLGTIIGITIVLNRRYTRKNNYIL